MAESQSQEAHPSGVALEIDDDDESSSGYYTEDNDSYATSLSSTIYQYQYENGRRYHAYKQGEYIMPNDEKQNQSLDILHHVATMLAEGELHMAPIGDKPERILDIGTGTGIWAMDMADKFPAAQVLGNDLSPIQPAWVPPNLQFEIDDINSEWTHRPGSFDLIHSRNMTLCIADGPKYVSEIWRALKPGGYVEAMDVRIAFQSDDNTIPPGSALDRWRSLYMDAEPLLGKHVELAYDMAKWLKARGFRMVGSTTHKIPVGDWPKDKKQKELGRLNLLQIMEGIEGFFMAFSTRLLGWSVTEAEVYMAEARQQLKDRKCHKYTIMVRTWAQKPEDAKD